MNDDRLNPFDDENLTFLVLRNADGDYSLWPSFAEIPSGWSSEFGPDMRQTCLNFIETHWVYGPGRKTTTGSAPQSETAA